MEKVSDALENRYIGILLTLFINKINEREKVREIMSVFEASYSKALEILSKRVTEILKEGKIVGLRISESVIGSPQNLATELPEPFVC